MKYKYKFNFILFYLRKYCRITFRIFSVSFNCAKWVNTGYFSAWSSTSIETEQENTALWFYINLANLKGIPTDEAIRSLAHSWIIESSLNIWIIWLSKVSLQMRALPPLFLVLLLPDSNLPWLRRRKDRMRTDVSFSSFLFSGRSLT